MEKQNSYINHIVYYHISIIEEESQRALEADAFIIHYKH